VREQLVDDAHPDRLSTEAGHDVGRLLGGDAGADGYARLDTDALERPLRRLPAGVRGVRG
jgi:hypothetical protein